MEVSKEFILEAHSEACSQWKQRIEKEVPELFKNRLEVGKWYKSKQSGHLFCCTKVGEFPLGYGFSVGGSWFNSDVGGIYFDHVEATKEEVETALIAEAKKRGFKAGVKAKSAYNDKKYELDSSGYDYNSLGEFIAGHVIVFVHGKWATIEEQVEEITIEQIQKELGRKIKIVE